MFKINFRQRLTMKHSLRNIVLRGKRGREAVDKRHK